MQLPDGDLLVVDTDLDLSKMSGVSPAVTAILGRDKRESTLLSKYTSKVKRQSESSMISEFLSANSPRANHSLFMNSGNIERTGRKLANRINN